MQFLLIGYINITLIFIGIASSGSLWPGSCFWYWVNQQVQSSQTSNESTGSTWKISALTYSPYPYRLQRIYLHWFACKPNYSALKNSTFRVANCSLKTEVSC
jgi:hypothetical protein